MADDQGKPKNKTATGTTSEVWKEDDANIIDGSGEEAEASHKDEKPELVREEGRSVTKIEMATKKEDTDSFWTLDTTNSLGVEDQQEADLHDGEEIHRTSEENTKTNAIGNIQYSETSSQDGHTIYDTDYVLPPELVVPEGRQASTDDEGVTLDIKNADSETSIQEHAPEEGSVLGESPSTETKEGHLLHGNKAELKDGADVYVTDDIDGNGADGIDKDDADRHVIDGHYEHYTDGIDGQVTDGRETDDRDGSSRATGEGETWIEAGDRLYKGSTGEAAAAADDAEGDETGTAVDEQSILDNFPNREIEKTGREESTTNSKHPHASKAIEYQMINHRMHESTTT